MMPKGIEPYIYGECFIVESMEIVIGSVFPTEYPGVKVTYGTCELLRNNMY